MSKRDKLAVFIIKGKGNLVTSLIIRVLQFFCGFFLRNFSFFWKTKVFL